jgi:hypothetical protein
MEKHVILPVELEHKAYWAIKFLNFDMNAIGEKRFLQLTELDEFRHHAYENAKFYKERTKDLHDKCIMVCEFKFSDKVLLYNSRLRFFPGKLRSRWSSPFELSKVFPSGAIRISYNEKGTFTLNGERLKHYFRTAILARREAWLLKDLPSSI